MNLQQKAEAGAIVIFGQEGFNKLYFDVLCNRSCY
jgi:hypothetical protein